MFRIKIKNQTITKANFEEVFASQEKLKPWEIQVFGVLEEWFGANEKISFFTSGTTGIPKAIHFTRSQVKASAKLTADTFGLDKNAKVLLCLPPQYVAGKMMILRAIINGWFLTVVEPKSIPNVESRYDFSALVPLQVDALVKKHRDLLEKIDQVIVGGAPISVPLYRAISGLKNRMYATYGMTETLTHIAIQPLNGSRSSSCFHALHGVILNQDQRDCLTIQAKHITEKIIYTNDVVRFVDFGKFVWLGRIDQVINSGGVKIYPENLEKKLQHLLDRRFYFIGENDEKLGQRLVLCIEGTPYDEVTLRLFENHLKEVLTTYEIPKRIIFVPKMKETESGKIIRVLQ